MKRIGLTRTGAAVTGVDRTRATLERYAEKVHTDFRSGIIAAALFVEASATMELTNTLYAQPEPPEKLRKRTGNLRASRMTTWTGLPTVNGTTMFKADAFATQDVAAGQQQAMADAAALVAAPRKNEFLAVIGYGAYYALYVHEGTEYMPAYKWLTNALNKDRDLIKDVVAGGMRPDGRSRRDGD
ncbi:MAG: hypothetical protein WC322_06400, partial [Candidatus Paceibacterota bacterium]